MKLIGLSRCLAFDTLTVQGGCLMISDSTVSDCARFIALYAKQFSGNRNFYSFLSTRDVTHTTMSFFFFTFITESDTKYSLTVYIFSKH